MKTKKKPDESNSRTDMSDEAIERRWREVAELYRLGVEMQSARLTGRKASEVRGSNPD